MNYWLKNVIYTFIFSILLSSTASANQCIHYFKNPNNNTNISKATSAQTMGFHTWSRLSQHKLEKGVASSEITFKADSPVFDIHFKNKPVVPGFMLAKIMASNGALLLAPNSQPATIQTYAANNVICTKKILPNTPLKVHSEKVTDPKLIKGLIKIKSEVYTEAGVFLASGEFIIGEHDALTTTKGQTRAKNTKLDFADLVSTRDIKDYMPQAGDLLLVDRIIQLPSSPALASIKQLHKESIFNENNHKIVSGLLNTKRHKSILDRSSRENPQFPAELQIELMAQVATFHQFQTLKEVNMGHSNRKPVSVALSEVHSFEVINPIAHPSQLRINVSVIESTPRKRLTTKLFQAEIVDANTGALYSYAKFSGIIAKPKASKPNSNSLSIK